MAQCGNSGEDNFVALETERVESDQDTLPESQAEGFNYQVKQGYPKALGTEDRVGWLKGTVPLPSDKSIFFLITGQHRQLSVLCTHKASCACVMSDRRNFYHNLWCFCK